MFTLMIETIGPAERRALQRAAVWGSVAWTTDAAFCAACGGGLFMALVYGAIIGWFGFSVGLIVGLVGERKTA